MKLPQHFNIKINMIQALKNGIGSVIMFCLFSITDPYILGLAFLFGAIGGSVNDIQGWFRNKEAIISHLEKGDSE